MVRNQSCLKAIQLWFKRENNFIILVGVYFLHLKLFLSNFISRTILNLTIYNFGGMTVTLREYYYAVYFIRKQYKRNMLVFYTNKKYITEASEIFIIYFEIATQGTESISF